METKREATKTRFNWPLLVASVIVLVVLSGAIYLRYSAAKKKTALTFLEHANELIEERNWSRAATFLEQYLRFHPEDAATWLRLAETQEKGAENRRQKEHAIELHYRALGVSDDPENVSALKRRLARLLVDVGRLREAEETADSLDSNDPEAARTKARSLYLRSRGGSDRTKQEAFDALQHALRIDPSDVELALIAATLCHDENVAPAVEERSRLADQLMDQMVAAPSNRNNAIAYLARFQYRRQHGLADAAEDLQRAIKLGPNDFPVLLAAGGDALQRAEVAASPGSDRTTDDYLTSAGRYFDRARELAPTRFEGYLWFGETVLRQGKPEDACQIWQEGLRRAGTGKLDLGERLASVLIATNRLDDARKAIDSFSREATRAAQNLPVDTPRRESVLLRNRVEILESKLDVAQNRPNEAIQRLDPLISTRREPNPGESREAGQWAEILTVQANGFQILGQWDRAAIALEKASKLVPTSSKLALASASAWKTVGNLEKAIEQFDGAVANGVAGEATWVALAESHLRRQLTLKASERSWAALTQALKNAHAVEPRSWRVRLLAAVSVMVKHGSAGQEKAIQYLRDAEVRAPADPALWERLVVIYERLRQSADADRALEQFLAVNEDRVTGQLLKASLLSLRHKHDEAVRIARRSLEQAEPDQRPMVLSKCAQIHLSAHDTDSARVCLVELHDLQPDDVNVLVKLAELDIQNNNVAQAEQWEDALRQLEGEDGASWRFYRVLRILAGVTGTIEEAQTLQTQIEKTRPHWPPAYVLKGHVFGHQGRRSEAIQAYEQAITLGEMNVAVFERLVALLYQENRFAEAEAYVARLRDFLPTSGALSSLSIALAAQLDELPEAVRRARESLDSHPGDPMARVWLGQVLALNGEFEESEKILREATRMAETDVRTWNALFYHYVQTDNRSAAEATLELMADKSVLTDVQRSFVLGQGYELLQDSPRALQQYREAVRLNPEDAQVRLRLATLLLQKDIVESESQVRQVLDANPDSRQARRVLATIRAAQGDEEAWVAAQQDLLAFAGDDPEAQIADRRLTAILLAKRGGPENRAKAREILDAITAKTGQASPVDRLLLARIHEADGNVQAAQQQYIELIGEVKLNPSHLGAYADFLLRHQKNNETSPILESLDSTTSAPGRGQDRLRFVALKSRWLLATGQGERIERLVERFATDQEQSLSHETARVRLFSQIGDIYLSVGMHKQAEPWFRKLLSAAPHTYPVLATTLCHLGRHEEAVELCLASEPADLSAKLFAALATVLSTSDPPAHIFDRVAPLVEDAMAYGNGDADILVAVSTILVLQDRNQEAIELLERANQARAKHVLTLNNLATLLSEAPEGLDRARGYINEAIEIAGEQPSLLDTKGMILVRQGDVTGAVQMLQRLSADPSPDPRYLFHLAIAHEQSGASQQARAAFENAVAGGLTSQVLTKADREYLRRLQDKFGV